MCVHDADLDVAGSTKIESCITIRNLMLASVIAIEFRSNPLFACESYEFETQIIIQETRFR